MLKRLLRRLPAREDIQTNRWLRWLGPALAHPRLWHMSRKGVAAGLALGLFFGLLVPIAQIPLAASAAVLIRANLPVAIGSTLVTNPVTFGPVYYGAYKLGYWMLHRGELPEQVAVSLSPGTEDPSSDDLIAQRISALHAPAAEDTAHDGIGGYLASVWTRIQSLGKPLILGLGVVATATGLAVYLLTTWVWAATIWMKRRRRTLNRRRA